MSQFKTDDKGEPDKEKEIRSGTILIFRDKLSKPSNYDVLL